MAENRYIGSYPVIGIRPTIDGRRGVLKVRESLEDQTMNMARAAAKLFEDNLRYSNGEPVKVVIADTTIGRVAEAAACEEKFRREGVAITLTVTPCWCYGAETMDMDRNTIKGVWGFNGTERPGAVYLASVLATHAQKGLPATPPFPRTCRPSCFASVAPPSPPPPCAASPTCRSAPSPWASAAPSSTPSSLRSTWACASSPWTRWKSSAA